MYKELHQEVKDGLEEIGWDRNQDPLIKRSEAEAKDHDQEMVQNLEEFHKKFDHTWVPHPRRQPDMEKLYFWILDVRFRINNPEENVFPLAEDITDRLAKINFITNPMKHYGDYRAEGRHFDMVQEKFQEKGVVPRWNVFDQPHTDDGDRRRPDRAMYQHSFKDGTDRIIIVEFDEAGHNDRTKESEQRKLYHQCIYFLRDDNEDNVVDIHIIRVDGGYDPIPDEAQAGKHAEMIEGILNSSFPDKPTITVHMLDFEEDHRHVKAYQARIIPQSNGIERATKEDQWNSKPMYDKVLLYSSS